MDLKEQERAVLRYDLLDCNIDICSPEVLIQIADNYDYQDLRQDFVRREVQNKVSISQDCLHCILH